MHYDVTVTSYMGCLYFFGMYGKKRPIAIPWYPISISRGLFFKFIGGCNNPLGKIYYEKWLGIGRLTYKAR